MQKNFKRGDWSATYGEIHYICKIEKDKIMKIVADVNIPFLKGVFEPYAEVVYKDGREISREDCADADVLVTRTRTRCDADLLEWSCVKMIATATITSIRVNPLECFLLMRKIIFPLYHSAF